VRGVEREIQRVRKIERERERERDRLLLIPHTGGQYAPQRHPVPG
jgi:hypothetical protein